MRQNGIDLLTLFLAEATGQAAMGQTPQFDHLRHGIGRQRLTALRDIRHGTGDLSPRKAGERFTLVEDPSGLGTQKTQHQTQQGGLSGPICAHDTDQRTRFEVKRKIAQHGSACK
nr:hypothetical protein [Asaia astilbis]